jgi:hypothetical protein
VDEAVASGHVEGSFLGVEGGGALVSFRMLHVFDLRDGLIPRGQAWFDTAGVLRQIEAHRRAPGNPPTARSYQHRQRHDECEGDE